MKYNRSPATSPALQRIAEALHERGPRPFAEILAAALRRLPADARFEVLDLADTLVAWPVATLRSHGGDRFPPAALLAVRDQP